jgi:imidazolonepropionase-like amidohydrolase
MKKFNAFLVIWQCCLMMSTAQPITGACKQVLVSNLRIFNEKDEKTIRGSVLIVNNLIIKISTAPIPVNKNAETIVIDGKGRVLMPGLIDNHVHLALSTALQDVLLTLSVSSIGNIASSAGVVSS